MIEQELRIPYKNQVPLRFVILFGSFSTFLYGKFRIGFIGISFICHQNMLRLHVKTTEIIKYIYWKPRPLKPYIGLLLPNMMDPNTEQIFKHLVDACIDNFVRGKYFYKNASGLMLVTAFLLCWISQWKSTKIKFFRSKSLEKIKMSKIFLTLPVYFRYRQLVCPFISCKKVISHLLQL